MKRVVWMASWFPSRVAPYLGDFVERHAQAASLYTDIHVIYAVKDRALGWGFQKERRQYSPTLSATIYYYPAFKAFGPQFEGAVSLLSGIILMLMEFVSYLLRRGKPSCIHVLVSWKAGVPALLCFLLFSVPYYVFERWSVFLDGSVPHINSMKRSEQWLIHRVFQHSRGITTTTAYFGRVLAGRYKKPINVIPNVIVPELFYPGSELPPSPFRFLHASTLDYPKNVEAILAAFGALLLDGLDCELVVYGPNKTFDPHRYERVQFGGEVSHAEIGAAMRSAHALVLFSRYETFGNVVIEAHASGLPVITSDHSVFGETVTVGVNGLQAKNEDVADLEQAMREMITHYTRFDRAQIAERALDKYSPQKIGTLFKDFYEGQEPI